MRATNILWDVEHEEELENLPEEIEIPDDILENCENKDEMEEAISDYISDETGFCHKGFKLVEKEQCFSRVINSTVCPYCGKSLIRLEPYEDSIYEFWCDDCDVDITITDNECCGEEPTGLWDLEELKRDYYRWKDELEKIKNEPDVYEEDIAMIQKIIYDYEEILF